MKICPKSLKNPFFPPSNYIPDRKLSIDPLYPPFAAEIGIFPSSYYKSFFLTQDFSESGCYEMVINKNGRYEIDVVDDWVPVY